MTDNIEDLLVEHGDHVWRIACRLLSDPEDARDCYQQTFLDAMNMDPEQVKNWSAMLRCVATGRAMDILRRRYRQRRTFVVAESEPVEFSPPETDLESEELRENVRRGLAGLPTNQAEAFWLRHVEQLSVEEVADQLGIQQGNVRVLVHRAATYLQRHLEPLYNDWLTTGGTD